MPLEAGSSLTAATEVFTSKTGLISTLLLQYREGHIPYRMSPGLTASRCISGKFIVPALLQTCLILNLTSLERKASSASPNLPNWIRVYSGFLSSAQAKWVKMPSRSIPGK